MYMQEEVVIGVMIGMVIGLAGVLTFLWLKAVTGMGVAAKQKEPAAAKVRAYRRKTTAKGSVDKVAVTAASSSSVSKKRGGRPAKAKTSVNKTQATVKNSDVTKNRRGRPNRTAVATSKTAATKQAESTTDAGSKFTNKPEIAGQHMLFEKLLQLSPEQLHALQTMPISESTLEKESLNT